MDIKELLSPQDSPAVDTPTQGPSPSPRVSPHDHATRPLAQQRTSSGLHKSSTLSTVSQDIHFPSVASPSGYQQQASPAQNITSSSYQQSGYHGQSVQAASYGQSLDEAVNQSQSAIQRQASTPQMDTLADLASMQQHHHQHPTNPASNGLQDSQKYDQSRTSFRQVSTKIELFKKLTINCSVSRSISTRSGADISMPEATPPPPKEFVSASLSDTDLSSLKELHTHIRNNSFDFQSHVAFINLLHKGFVQHVHSGQDTSGYELLEDVRQAREAMDRNFPVGEALWIDWLNDESSLAFTVDQCISVARLFERAIQDEPNSTSLWKLYGDYWYRLFTVTHDSNTMDSGVWSSEDNSVAHEVFTWESVRAKWDLAYQNTRWRLNDSNAIFDRYMEILMDDEKKSSTSQKVEEINNLFRERLLKEPHATWDQTAQAYSSFITSHYSAAAYEQVMADLTRLSTQVKNMYRQREMYEDKIEQAHRGGNQDVEWTAYAKYIEWEITGKGPFSFPIINSLYQRATIHFATDASLWTDYVEFLMQNPNKEVPLRAVLERATRHCPWSGDLWSHRILAMENEGESFKAIEEVKHRATANGMLDAGGMEELIKVSLAWCGCLRRRAFEPGAADDEIDIAEMGLRSSIEHVRKIGERKYGNEYKGDPQYRLERIHIKFLTQRGETETAREIWKSLIPAHANSHDFWYRYYIWEMVCWSKFAMRSGNEPEHQLQVPSDATTVLSQALQHHATMDWPEQLTEMYLNHCEQHESVQKLRSAVIETRRISGLITKRREKESAARSAYYEQQVQDGGSSHAQIETVSGGKRKRDEDEATTDQLAKRAKPEEQHAETGSSTTQQPKRDREHTVVIAKNIPLDATELNVRGFFRECGTIVSLKLRQDGNTQVASVEFETHEDALTAQSRTLKKLKGQEIEVDFGVGTTLWVTNYPPSADEQYIRNLFKDIEIIEVRFPTLLKNARRRFCYVQCATSVLAIKATEFDGTELEDKGEKYTLQVKLSDPTKKDSRHGPLHEGREVYMKNLNWAANEDDVIKYFEKAGTIESVRIPRHMNGKSKGFAFIVFETAAEAEAAVEKFRNGFIKGRRFDIEISLPKEQRTTTTIHRGSVASGSAGSPPPSGAASAISPEAADPETNGKRPELEKKSTGGEVVQETGKNVRERTLALMNVPDIVTPARIEKLLEPYGAIKKLTLRPDHAGAIIEFAEEKSVHSASLGVSGTEIDGSTIRTGMVKELLEQAPMKRELRLDQKKSDAAKKTAATNPFANSLIHRPGDKSKALGGKGRGNLGSMKSGFGHGASSAPGKTGEAAKTGFKTNEDFRAMFLGEKKGSGDDAGSKKDKVKEMSNEEDQKHEKVDHKEVDHKEVDVEEVDDKEVDDEEVDDGLDDLMGDSQEEYEDEGIGGTNGDVNGDEEATEA